MSINKSDGIKMGICGYLLVFALRSLHVDFLCDEELDDVARVGPRAIDILSHTTLGALRHFFGREYKSIFFFEKSNKCNFFFQKCIRDNVYTYGAIVRPMANRSGIIMFFEKIPDS